MLDLKFVRENPDIVKQNIKNKFQDGKLPLVDEVIELDAKSRATQKEADDLRASRNKLSKQIGQLMGQGKKEEAEAVKQQVSANSDRLSELQALESELSEKITKIMMTIPNIIDPSVPIGKDDSENVEVERFGEPVVPDFEIPYHTEIMERFNGCQKGCGQRLLLSDGGYRQTSLRCDFLRPRLYDQPRLYLLRASLYDPQQCGDRRYELRRDGRHDV